MSEEYCDNCRIVTPNEWEIWCCSKNPEGLTTHDHVACDDDYCVPSTMEIDNDDPRILQSDKYEVHPRCAKCNYLRGY